MKFQIAVVNSVIMPSCSELALAVSAEDARRFLDSGVDKLVGASVAVICTILGVWGLAPDAAF